MSRCRSLLLCLLVPVGFSLPALGEIKAVAPQPSAEALADGLAVTYYYQTFRNIRELVEGMGNLKPHPGTPLPDVNYKVGEGRVLTSDSFNYVGAHITGLLNLDTAGTYQLEVTSNDGVRVTLGGEMIYEDPDVHSDWTSEPIDVPVTEPGWYPVEILYFEKQGTSTLIIRWKPPGAADFEAVPTTAFKHMQR